MLVCAACVSTENETQTGGKLMKLGREGAGWINNPDEITLTLRTRAL